MAFNREKTLANAQKQLRKGNVDRAIKEYERVLEADPSDIRSKLKLADLLVKVDDYDAALQAYGEVAYAYAQDDLYEKAAAVYKQALRVAPENPEFHAQLGEAYYRLGRLKDAVRVLHKAQKIFKRAGDAASQRSILERMTQIDPEDIGLRIQLAERYEKDGLRQEALDLFGDAASHLRAEGRLDEYVQVAERIIYLQPDLFDMRKEVVRIYLGRGDEKHALKHLQRCFKVDPQDVETLELLASTFHRLGSDKKSVLVYSELAALYERDNELDRAGSVYRTILSIDPSHGHARMFLGREASDPEPSPPQTANPGPPEPEPHELDALDGIEFLDADDEDVDEVLQADPTNEKEGDSFMAFAEDTIRGLETDADLNSIQAYPEASIGGENTAAIEISESSLEVVEAIPVETEESDQSDQESKQITQFLTESEVFLKYGLLDRAEDVITKVLQIEPDSLGGRDQMRKLLERLGDKRGAAHQLVEMARITRDQKDRSNAYLRQASNLVDETALRTLADGAGLELDIDAIDEAAPEFIDEVSEGIEEMSSAEEIIEEDLGAHSIEIELDDDDLEDILILDDDDFLEEVPENSGTDVPEGPPSLGAGPTDQTIEELELEEITQTERDPDFDVEEIEIGDVEVDELSMDGADVMDLDIDEVDFDEEELAVLEQETDGEDLDFDISSDDADAMFDELFGGGGFEAEPVTEDGLGGEETLGHFGSEAEDLVSESGLSIDVDAVNNSSLELGKTYQDMGLFAEAIEEFTHALDDPEAAPAALFHIALCHIELGEEDDAQSQLTQLASDESTPNGWREKANEKLAELGA